MFKKSKKVWTIENSKVGKNDNIDLGNNKNNKIKKVDKKALKNIKINSDNIEFNPNLVYVELIKEIAQKESSLAKRKYNLKQCKECSDIIKKALEEKIDQKNAAIEKYDIAKQWRSGSSIILDGRNFIHQLELEIHNIADFRGIQSCKKHTNDLNEINFDYVELQSLKESIKYFNK